jgi:glutathione S-transferase
MLTIYGVLRSRASRVDWLARELGLAYTRVPVIQAYRLPDPAAPDAPFNTASPEFRAINPNGRIPSVVDGDLTLHESFAITLHLARSRGGPLAPQDAREEALMGMWTLWGATECESHALTVLLHGGPDRPAQDREAAEAATAALRPRFAVLEGALGEGGGHVVGGRFTVADLNLAEVFRYAQGAEALFAAHPGVARWLAACQARPAFRAMMEERAAEPA